MGTMSQFLIRINKMRLGSHFIYNYNLKQIFGIVLFVLILFPSCSLFQKKKNYPVEHTFERSYYDTTQLEYEASYLNGKLDGISRVWYPSGKLQSYSEYKYNYPHGKWKKYFENGFLMYEVSYSHGLKQGYEKWYHDNGRLKSEQEFEDDKPLSTITRWKPDGTLLY